MVVKHAFQDVMHYFWFGWIDRETNTKTIISHDAHKIVVEGEDGEYILYGWDSS